MSWFDVVRPARTAAALAAVLMVAACGGGGGGGGDDKTSQSGATPQSASVGLGGVASKGLLKNAVVKVSALTPAGTVGALLATARTDSTGHYQISGLTAGALVYVEVIADSATRMADEATGLDLTPSVGFELRAVQTLSSQGSTVLQVTPFSELAVVIALANGGLTPEVIAAANARVELFFNYQGVLTTEPTFGAGNKPTNPAAVNLAALSLMAKNGVFADCTGAGKSDAAKVECVVAELTAKGVGDDDLVAKLEAAKDDVKKTYVGKDPVPAVQPQRLSLPVGAVKSGIAEAKALIQNVRSNADKSVTDALAQRFQAVSDQFQNAIAPVNDQSQKLMLVIAQATAVLDNPARELGAPFTGTYRAVDVVCNLYSDDASSTLAVNYDEVKSIQCTLNAGSGYGGPGSASTTGESSWSENLLTQNIKIGKTATAHSYAVQTRVNFQNIVHHTTYQYYGYNPVTQQYETMGTNSQWDTSGPVTPLSNVNAATATLNPTSTGAPYGAMTLKGNLAPNPFGTFQAQDHLTVDLSMVATAADGLTRINLKGNMQAVINGITSTQVLVNDGSYLQLRTAVPGDAGSALVDDQTGAAFHLLVSSASTLGASVTGTLQIDLSAFSVAKNNGHGKISFNGKVYKAGGDLLFDGTIALTAPSDPVVVAGKDPVVPDGSIALDGTLPIPTRPDMVVHLTTSTNSTNSTHSFVGSYAQGTDNVLISGAFDETSGVLTSLTLSTPSGVTATVHPYDTTFNITKGTDVLGVFTASNGRILYADNTYEQY